MSTTSLEKKLWLKKNLGLKKFGWEKFQDFVDLFTFILIASDKTIGIYIHARLGLKS